MSWKDSLQTDLILLMGDGNEYRPKWVPDGLEQDFNSTNFEFPEIEGTLVDRRKRKGYVYTLTLFYDGPDHLDNASAFRESANDPRIWQMTHPYYGVVSVQPTGIRYDNTGYNATKIMLTVMESLTTAYPQTSVQPVAQIQQNAVTANTSLSDTTARNAKPTAANTAQVITTNNKFYTIGLPELPTDIANDYYNAYQEALAESEDLVSSPLDAIQATQRLAVFPAYFALSVSRRIKILTAEYQSQVITESSLPFVTLPMKYLYQALTGTILNALFVTASTPQDGDYMTRTDVAAVAAQLTDLYNGYITQLDILQTANGGAPDSFIPDAAAIMQLTDLYYYTLSNLFTIALNAQQERTFILEEDSTWILLTHRLYGLDLQDANLDRLIKNNNAGLTENLIVPKGRTITYYI